MPTLDESEISLLSRLRRNARESLSSISRAAGVSVTTLFYKHRKLEKELIAKYASIMNFTALGYGVRVWLVARTSRKKSAAVEGILRTNKNVNNAYRVAGEQGLNATEYLVEAIFRDYGKTQEFAQKLAYAGARVALLAVTSEELKKEGFLTRPEHYY